MKVDTLSTYNITPETTHFRGRLRTVDVDAVDRPESLSFKEPTVILLDDNTHVIPQDLKAIRPNVTGIIFSEGGGFYHPALCISA